MRGADEILFWFYYIFNRSAHIFILNETFQMILIAFNKQLLCKS